MDRQRRKHKKNKKSKGTAPRSNEKKTARNKSCGKEYLEKMEFQNINITNPEEFLNHTINNMEEKTKAIKMDPRDTTNRAAIEDELKPMNVTPRARERIKDIPRSKSVSWYIDTNKRDEQYLSFIYCNIYLVDEMNLLDHHKSNLVACIGVSMCIMKTTDLHSDIHGTNLMKKERDLILGTFAKTCLNPDSAVALRGLCSGQSVLPAEVILNSSGLVDRMKLDLMELGVSRVSIAHSGLITDSKKTFKKTVINTRPYSFDKIPDAIDRGRFYENVRCNCFDIEEQYVSEEIEDLNGWVPPNIVPAHWFVKSPEEFALFEPDDLFGWRTNLGRAIENADESKVIEITNAHSAEKVREYCEIKNLLFRMAADGLKESCRLLLDYCSVSVEGSQASNVKDEWRYYMNIYRYGGHKSITPLMTAAYAGYYEVCELLLDYNANVNAGDKVKNSTVLQLAVSNGQKDVVKLLCKHGADISQGHISGHDAISIADYIAANEIYKHTGATVRHFERIAEILREYDYNHCSYCRNGVGLLKQCPCHKERYCNGSCQMQRWHCHKVLHNKAMRKINCHNR